MTGKKSFVLQAHVLCKNESCWWRLSSLSTVGCILHPWAAQLLAHPGKRGARSDPCDNHPLQHLSREAAGSDHSNQQPWLTSSFTQSERTPSEVTCTMNSGKRWQTSGKNSDLQRAHRIHHAFPECTLSAIFPASCALSFTDFFLRVCDYFLFLFD